MWRKRQRRLHMIQYFPSCALARKSGQSALVQVLKGLGGDREMSDLILDPYLRNAALDCFMDAALLWAAGAVVKQRRAWYRLLAGALIGGIFNLWLGLARDGFLGGWNWLSAPPVHLGIIPLLMLTAAFIPLRFRSLLKVGGAFFLLSLAAWGLASALFYFLALRGMSFSPFLAVFLEVGLVLAVAELGWGAVHRAAVARVCQIPLSCALGEIRLETEGYLDTGNHLKDPVSRRPVVVLDYGLMRPFLTPEARAFIEAVAEGSPLPSLPASDPWTTRLRVIPYRSIQRHSGLMPGLRTDTVRLGKGTASVCHKSVVIGLELAGGLGKEEVRALIPPALWSTSLMPAQPPGRV